MSSMVQVGEKHLDEKSGRVMGLRSVVPDSCPR